MELWFRQMLEVQILKPQTTGSAPMQLPSVRFSGGDIGRTSPDEHWWGTGLALPFQNGNSCSPREVVQNHPHPFQLYDFPLCMSRHRLVRRCIHQGNPSMPNDPNKASHFSDRGHSLSSEQLDHIRSLCVEYHFLPR